MSKYIDELDFIRRTRILVDRFTPSDYDVTFLINCCLGLLVVPKERAKTVIKNHRLGQVNLIDWGIDPTKFNSGKCPYDDYDPCDVECVVKHIRDSLAHALFQLCPNNNEDHEKIEFITFEDGEGFRLCISVEDFKKFIIKYATTVEDILAH